MIILLDTTAIMSDPTCAGTAWRVLANAPSTWGIQIFVPEVVLVEAIAGYQRRINEAVVSIGAWEKKHASLLTSMDITKPINIALKESAASYPIRLRDSLNELRVQVLAPPNVDHMELVQRAATRRRPCDDKGDGYRDTLNWLTVLALASQHSDDQIAWVSDNTRDFGNGNGLELHEDLKGELVALGAEKRVRWIRTLADLVLILSAENTLGERGSLREIQTRLQAEVLNEFISTQVLNATVGTAVDARQCGLPTTTTSAKVLAIGRPGNFNFTVRGTAADDQAVVEFELEASTSIEIEVPPGTTPDIAGLATAASVDPTGATIQLTKLLSFAGLVTLDRFERPSGGELTRISALQDDPGLAQWAIRDVRISYSSLGISAIPPELFQSLALPSIPPDLLKAIKTPNIPPDLLEAMKTPAISPDLLKAMTLPTIPPNLLKAMKTPVISPDLLRAMAIPIVPPNILASLKLPIIPPELLKNILPNISPPKSVPSASSDEQVAESDAADSESLDNGQPDDDAESEGPDQGGESA